MVYAEAFERDADPDDFFLDALLAHECGHQLLIRDPNLRRILAKFSMTPFEEVLASLIGSILLKDPEISQSLVWKATAELGQLNLSAEKTISFVERLRKLLRHYL